MIRLLRTLARWALWTVAGSAVFLAVLIVAGLGIVLLTGHA